MSSTSNSPSIPEHWAPAPPSPRETRYLCLLDGTTIEGSDARRRHDEHFHADTKVAEAARPDDAWLRATALEQAVKAGLGYGGGDELARATASIVAFLRDGTTQPDPNLGTTKVDAPIGPSGAPEALHEAIDRAWGQVGEGHDHPLHRDQADEDDLVEVLQQLGADALTRTVKSLQIVRAVAFSTKAER